MNLRRLALPLLLGAGIRAALFFAATPARRLYEPDSFDYLTLGRNLAAGGPFSRDERPPFHAEILRTPVYPSFLAGLARAGLPLSTAGVAAGVLLSWLAIPLAFLAARRWGIGRRGSAAAAFLVAADVGAAAYANFLLSEALFVVLLLLAFAALGGAERETPKPVKAGLLLGLAILCRPIALGLPLFLALGRKLRFGLLLVGSSAAIVVPWMARNGIEAGSFTVSSVASVNLYYHRAEKVLDAGRGREEEPPARPPGANDPSAISKMRKDGLAVLRRHPATLARLTLKAWVRTFGPDERPIFLLLGIPVGPEPRWLSRGPAPLGAAAAAETVGEAIFLASLALLFFRGIATLRDPRSRPLVVSALAVVAYFLVVSGPEYYGRFRVPVVPFLALVAGAGCARPAAEAGG